VTFHVKSHEALQTFRANPHDFDLILTDMTMPDITGDRLAKEILLIKSDTPIIICTGFSERINKEQAEMMGVKGFLMKPVIKSDLAEMIRNVLDEYKKSR
jgi:two-component system, cell cycle sensor histidine kinase and response regulator CckA